MKNKDQGAWGLDPEGRDRAEGADGHVLEPIQYEDSDVTAIQRSSGLQWTQRAVPTWLSKRFLSVVPNVM